MSPNHRKTGEHYCVKCRRTFQSPVHWDSVNHWINLHPLDNAIGFRNTYALNSGLSGEWRYPSIEQRGPGVEFNIQVQKTVQKEKEYFVVACLHPTEKVVVVKRWQKKVQKKCVASEEMLFYCFVDVIAAVAVVRS